MIVDFIEPTLDDVVLVSYDGDTDKISGVYQGTGTAVFDNDCNYTGKFKNGMFQGKGKFNWPNGISFEGDFDMGVINGKGVYAWHDGSTYQGEVLNGKRHGTGKFNASCGQLYEGEWKGGKRHGTGKIWYNEEKTSFYSVRCFFSCMFVTPVNTVVLISGRVGGQPAARLRHDEVRLWQHL